MREKLIELLDSYYVDYGAAVSFLTDQESEDIAQLLIDNGVTIPVRCRDCKHYRPQFQGAHRNCTTPYCMRCTAVKVSPNDFCSYGERRTDG